MIKQGYRTIGDRNSKELQISQNNLSTREHWSLLASLHMSKIRI